MRMMRVVCLSLTASLASALVAKPQGSLLAGVRSAKGTGGDFIFDYQQHGRDWEEGWCPYSDGAAQSPINLQMAVVNRSEAPMPFHYRFEALRSGFEIHNTGSMLQADFQGQGLGGLMWLGEWYNLLNVNFHAQSEHTFEGKHAPLEIHMVHKSAISKKLVTIALPVGAWGQEAGGTPPPTTSTAGPTTPTPTTAAPAPAPAPGATTAAGGSAGPTTTAMVTAAPTTTAAPTMPPGTDPLSFFSSAPFPMVNQKSTVAVSFQKPLDLNSWVEGGKYIAYYGSTTAPPCAERVNWLVRTDPLEASSDLLKFFDGNLYTMSMGFGNYREVQPRNSRPFRMAAAVYDKPTPWTVSSNQQGWATATDPQALPSDREVHARKIVDDTLHMASSDVNFVKHMDERMRNAAQAHADVLSGKMPLLRASLNPTPLPSGPSAAEYGARAQALAAPVAVAARNSIGPVPPPAPKGATTPPPGAGATTGGATTGGATTGGATTGGATTGGATTGGATTGGATTGGATTGGATTGGATTGGATTGGATTGGATTGGATTGAATTGAATTAAP